MAVKPKAHRPPRYDDDDESFVKTHKFESESIYYHDDGGMGEPASLKSHHFVVIVVVVVVQVSAAAGLVGVWTRSSGKTTTPCETRIPFTSGFTFLSSGSLAS